MYLLDTDVVSALRRPERNLPIANWLRRQNPDSVFTSAITIGEIMYGAVRQRRRQPEYAALLHSWLLDYVEALFEDHILPFDAAAAKRWGVLRVELGYTSSDLQIAAVALDRGFTVVTRNVRDFGRTGVAILNPASSP